MSNNSSLTVPTDCATVHGLYQDIFFDSNFNPFPVNILIEELTQCSVHSADAHNHTRFFHLMANANQSDGLRVFSQIASSFDLHWHTAQQGTASLNLPSLPASSGTNRVGRFAGRMQADVYDAQSNTSLPANATPCCTMIITQAANGTFLDIAGGFAMHVPGTMMTKALKKASKEFDEILARREKTKTAE